MVDIIKSSDVLKEEIEKVCRLEGDFTLRSGQKSNYYFDKYLFESDPRLLHQICLQFKHRLSEDFDYFAGLETGGIPIATMLGFIMNKPVLFVRKEAKTYGTKKLAEGPDFAGKRICVVEDVVTSGGQVVKSVNDLRDLGAEIAQVICVILRDEKGRKNIDKEGLNLYALFEM